MRPTARSILALSRARWARGFGSASWSLPSRLAEAMTAAKRLFDGGGSWLEQAALAEMMQGSSYSTHVTRVRAHYLENRDVLIAALKRNFGEGGISGEGGGLHLLWRLPPGVPDAAVVEAHGGAAANRRLQPSERRGGLHRPILARSAGADAWVWRRHAEADRPRRRPSLRDHRRCDRRPRDRRNRVSRAAAGSADSHPTSPRSRAGASGLPIPSSSGSTERQSPSGQALRVQEAEQRGLWRRSSASTGIRSRV